MSVAKAVLLVSSCVSLVVYVSLVVKGGNSPRGPIGLPVLGYYLYLGKDTYDDFQRLAPIYGSIFSVQIGNKNVIVLNDFQSNKDAFSQDAFMGRPPMSSFEFQQDTIASGAYHGLPWKEQRSFSLRMIQDLMKDQSLLEDMIKAEISEMTKRLEAFGSNFSSIRPLLSPSVTNAVGFLMFGQRLSFDHSELKKLDNIMTETSAGARQMAWQMFFPWIAKVHKSLKKGPDEKVSSLWKDFREYVGKQITKHEKNLDPKNPKDFVDGYLLEIKKRKNSTFTRHALEDIAAVFYSVGSDTVRSAVEWLTLAAAAHPAVQAEVQREVDEVVGRSRPPAWSDRLRMPYTRATVSEAMRWRTVTPLSLVRYTLWDTELDGYFIPKNSYVFSNLWSIHHDKEYWGPDAEDFRPERFLTDKKEVKVFERFVPYSMGKRSCPGESFAEREIFLYFSTIMQNFNVSRPSGGTLNLKGEMGVSLSPKPQALRFQPRS